MVGVSQNTMSMQSLLLTFAAFRLPNHISHFAGTIEKCLFPAALVQAYNNSNSRCNNNNVFYCSNVRSKKTATVCERKKECDTETAKFPRLRTACLWRIGWNKVAQSSPIPRPKICNKLPIVQNAKRSDTYLYNMLPNVQNFK